jgi:hypothetical protein
LRWGLLLGAGCWCPGNLVCRHSLLKVGLIGPLVFIRSGEVVNGIVKRLVLFWFHGPCPYVVVHNSTLAEDGDQDLEVGHIIIWIAPFNSKFAAVRPIGKHNFNGRVWITWPLDAFHVSIQVFWCDVSVCLHEVLQDGVGCVLEYFTKECRNFVK